MAPIPWRTGSNGRYPLRFYCGYYRKRHRVENFIQRSKALRGLATRYDKKTSCFFDFAFLASILDWLRSF